MNRLATRREAGHTVAFHYNTEEDLTSVTNEHGNAWRFEYDENRELIREYGFDQLRRIYTRDAAGRVVRLERSSGAVVHYTHDPLDRITCINYGNDHAENWTWDADGQLLAAASPDCTVRFERDAAGRILREWQDDFWVESRYDAVGRRREMRSCFGAVQTIERNSVGDAVGVTAATASSTSPSDPAQILWQTRIRHDQLGMELERELPGGIRSRWERDQTGRPIQHQILRDGNAVRDVRYEWDVNYRLKRIVSAQTGAVSFEFDAAGNLAAASFENGLRELRTPMPLVTCTKPAIAVTVATENPENCWNPATSVAPHASNTTPTVTSHAKSPPKVPGTMRGTPPECSEPSSVPTAKPSPSATTPSVAASAARPMAKPHAGSGTATTPPRMDPALAQKTSQHSKRPNQRLPRQKQPPSWHSQHTRPQDHRTNLSSNPNHCCPHAHEVITWLFDPDTLRPAAKLQGERAWSIVTDYLGTPTTMLDENGRTVWSADLSIYGQIKNLTTADNETQTSCPFRWLGQYEDEDTGLYYNRFRYYDPATGTYISQDPIRLAGGLNICRYVHDPLTCGRPDGVEWEERL
jgi:RHS repeat-associated protein